MNVDRAIRMQSACEWLWAVLRILGGVLLGALVMFFGICVFAVLGGPP